MRTSAGSLTVTLENIFSLTGIFPSEFLFHFVYRSNHKNWIAFVLFM